MLEIAIKAAGRNVTPGDLPAILGARRAYQELGDMIEALIAQMDLLAGDADAEECDLEDSFAFSEPVARRLALADLLGAGCPISDGDSSIDDGPCDGETDSEECADHRAPFLTYGVDQSEPLPTGDWH